MVWPGYECKMECFNDGYFLNIDTATKFVSSITIYDKIMDLKKNRYSPSEIRDILAPKDEN